MPQRKRLRPNKPTERSGVNALRAFLEEHECVVQEVDAANDYGKDLLVDLTENQEITGQVIAIQVKSGKSFFRDGVCGIPASSVDLCTWLDSSIPVFGVVFEPQRRELYWINLSAYVHEEMSARHEHKHPGGIAPSGRPQLRGHFVPIPKGQVLAADSWVRFVDGVREYGRRFGGNSILNLAAADVGDQLSAVHDCFALGRGDARALILVRYAITKLTSWALMAAVRSLSHCGSHPDIFWNEQNWIPRNVKDQVRGTFKWSPEELWHVIHELEMASSEGFPVWERGGSGQDFVVILQDSPDLCRNIYSALSMACDGLNPDVSFQVLVLYQYFLGVKHAGLSPKDGVEKAMQRWPLLASHPYANELVSDVNEFGWVDIF